LLPIIFIFKGSLLHPGSGFVGRNADACSFMWYLGWFWHAVLTAQNPLLSTMVNYPSSVNLMANPGVVAEAVLFGPIVYLFNAVFAYNVAMISAFLLIGIVGAAIFKSLGVRKYLATLGGLLFQISPFAVNQSVDGHLHLIFAYVIILSLIYLLILMLHANKPLKLHGVMLGLLLSCLFYTSLEMFAVLFLISLIAFTVFLMIYQKELWANLKLKVYGHAFNAAITSLILILPGLVVFFFGPSGLIFQPVFQSWVYNSSVLNFFIPSQAQWLNFTLSFYSVPDNLLSEANAYIGIPALSILCLSRFFWRTKLSRSLIWLLLIIIVLSLGPCLRISDTSLIRIDLPWLFIQKLPLLGNVLPCRLMLFADIIFVILTVLGVEHASKKCGKLSQCLFLTLLALTAVSWLPNWNFWHQSLPLSFHSIEKGGALYPKLVGQPVTIIESSYGNIYEMGALPGGFYAFPVTNAYQFPYTSRPLDYSDFFIFSDDYQNLNVASAKLKLQRFLKIRNPKRIVYLPSKFVTMPPSLQQALTELFGKPFQKDGVELWELP
jgi:hypothetical protein